MELRFCSKFILKASREAGAIDLDSRVVLRVRWIADEQSNEMLIEVLIGYNSYTVIGGILACGAPFLLKVYSKSI